MNISGGTESCQLLCEINSGLRISCLCSFTKRITEPEAGLGKRKAKEEIKGNGDGKDEQSKERESDSKEEMTKSMGKKVKFL